MIHCCKAAMDHLTWFRRGNTMSKFLQQHGRRKIAPNSSFSPSLLHRIASPRRLRRSRVGKDHVGAHLLFLLVQQLNKVSPATQFYVVFRAGIQRSSPGSWARAFSVDLEQKKNRTKFVSHL